MVDIITSEGSRKLSDEEYDKILGPEDQESMRLTEKHTRALIKSQKAVKRQIPFADERIRNIRIKY